MYLELYRFVAQRGVSDLQRNLQRIPVRAFSHAATRFFALEMCVNCPQTVHLRNDSVHLNGPLLEHIPNPFKWLRWIRLIGMLIAPKRGEQ
jgi:hypothetical protein